MRPAPAVVLAAVLTVSLGGCANLLPRGSTDTPAPFVDFAQAQAAVQRIVPLQTRPSELKALGFDPEGGRNVTLIPYPDVLARLAPYSGVPMDALDPGIRRCIAAQSGCRAFLFHFDQQVHHREGGFWADFFNVRRVTRVTGWSFDALVVVDAEAVLFRNHGGQPRVDRVERQVNPLGPFQPAGESAGSVLVR